MPQGFPPSQTCHCRFQQWVRSGALARVLEALAERTSSGEAAWTFRNALLTTLSCLQKRSLGVGKTKRGKGSKLIAVTDSEGLALAAHVAGAAPSRGNVGDGHAR
jgi:transposase